MKKLCALALCLALCVGLLPSAAWAAGPEVKAKAVLLMEKSTGEILYEEHGEEPLELASVTKVMTMLLIMEALEDGTLTPDTMVAVSANAAGMGGSQVYMKEGETFSVHDMLKAIAVASGNDACVAMAEHLAGSEAAFVERMNARAAELGMGYEEGNFIVAHVGGGLSVACHEHGHMVDTNDVLEGAGPFAPNRSGDVPAKPVVKMAFSEGASKKQMDGVVGKTGGLLGLLGTDDARQIIERIENGDEWAATVYDAMAYQVAKYVAGFAAVVRGKVNGIVLTGGVSHDPRFVSYVTERVGWIAPVKVYAGDFEMDALAAGAIRALDGKESVMTYTGEPSWKGFACEGALPDVEG